MQISDTGNGVTRDSLAFYRDNRHRIGDLTEVYVRFPGYDDPHDPYLMQLRDRHGDELRLSGCTTGYVGEGPHGSMNVLISEGCPVVQAMVVLGAATARFTRDESGEWAVAEYTLANVDTLDRFDPALAPRPRAWPRTMLTSQRRDTRMHWKRTRSRGGDLTLSATLRSRRALRGAPSREAGTPQAVIPELPERGLSLGEIAAAVGERRHRVLESQRGVYGVSRRNWTRLTALRDVVLTLDRSGIGEPRRWLYTYRDGPNACPYERLVVDDSTPALDAARNAKRS